MADSPFELSIDSDWKKQAQEEKRRLAEEAEKKKAASAASPSQAGDRAASATAAAGARRRAKRELPEASFETLVRSMAGQVNLYLGLIPVAGGEQMLDLDAAKHQIDLLAVLDDKTGDSLTESERSALDLALYEARSRYVGVASQYIL